MDPLQLICSLVTGLCVAGIAITNRGNFGALIDFVERDLADRLRSLRIRSRQLRRWINAWLALVGAVFFTLWLGLNAFWPALLLAILMSAGPWYLIRRLAQIRRQKLEDQLADAMVMFSSAVRAGMSVPQAMDMLAIECPKPINQEFRQIAREYDLGKPLERTLTEAKERLRSENFVLFSAALLASRESGGRLNETVERIAKSVIELQRLERKVVSETAQARKSAVYMAIVPPLVLACYWILDNENVTRFLHEPAGQIMLSISVILNLVAYVWARKILSPEI